MKERNQKELMDSCTVPEVGMPHDKEIRGFCIICRENNKVMSDEHVIPYALGGRYHVYNVCVVCNGKLGEFVDTPLLEHWPIKAERHTYGLKGHSKHIPNPLTGDAILTSTGEKVKIIENEKGQIEARYIPSKPKITKEEYVDSEGKKGMKYSMSFRVDKHDEKLINKTLKSITKHLKLGPDLKVIEHNRIEGEIANPEINVNLSMDLKNFKMGFLKMAYEFACDKLPEYLNDPEAIKISGILHSHNFNLLDDIPIIGDGFSDFFFKNTLSHLIDFSNSKRHYLLLLNIDGKLYCFVNLFAKFTLGFEMADREYVEHKDMMLLVINDFATHSISYYTLPELNRKVVHGERRGFKFTEVGESIMKEISSLGSIGFAADENDDTLLYDASETVISTFSEFMQSYSYENTIETPISETETRYEYPFPSGVYVKVMTSPIIFPPQSLLVPIQSFVEVEHYNRV